MATDHSARDSARYSIVAEEWSAVKARLKDFITSYRSREN
jgi:hypothetical protein